MKLESYSYITLLTEFFFCKIKTKRDEISSCTERIKIDHIVFLLSFFNNILARNTQEEEEMTKIFKCEDGIYIQ